MEHAGHVRSYRDLTVWKRVRGLVKQVYEMSSRFPAEERFGLTAQVRRAAVSLASNIAEGWGRGTRRDYVHFLHAARGSLYEVEAQFALAQDLAYSPFKDVAQLQANLNDCSKLLSALIRSLSKNDSDIV
jgi:four helix bundle protein